MSRSIVGQGQFVCSQNWKVSSHSFPPCIFCISAHLSLSSYISSGFIGSLNLSTTGNITLGIVKGGQISLACNGAFLNAKVVALAPLYIFLHVCLWMQAPEL